MCIEHISPTDPVNKYSTCSFFVCLLSRPWSRSTSSSESGAEAAKREKRRGHAQQAAALRQKLSVLLCQSLLPPSPATASATGSSTSVSTAAPKDARQSAKELRKKMAVLGMIHGPQAGIAGGGEPLVSTAAGNEWRAGTPEDRTAAQTRWLDGSAGHLFGGTWSGGVRTGASCDSTSLEVRAQVEAAKQEGNGAAVAVGSGDRGVASGKGRRNEGLVATAALAKWKPNPDTPDPEKWGGRWGKPCGHNEVCLDNIEILAVAFGHSFVGEQNGEAALLAHDRNHLGTEL